MQLDGTLGRAVQRHVWMDAIRGGAILLVIVYHADAIMGIHGLTPPGWIQVFNDALSPYRMPLLIYLSGLLLQRSLTKPWRTFALGKLRNIGWPYVVWSLITLAATTGVTVRALLGIVVIPPTFLWFLWFILAFYAIGWVCHQLQLDPLAVAVAAVLASAFLPDFARASRFAFLLAFFMLGHAVATRGTRFRPPRLVRRALILACLASMVFVSAQELAGREVRYEATFVLGPLALVLLVQLCSPWYRPSRWLRPVEYVGRSSIVFYVAHYSIQWVIVEAAAGQGRAAHGAIYALAVGVPLAAGFALCRLRDTSQLFGLLFAFPERVPASRTRV